jgi:ORF6N domain
MLIKQIQNKIYTIRNQRVMLDYDLALMYEVETRVLNQAVKRNINRFPSDFMFQLSKSEWDNLISQIVISKTEKRGGTQKSPYAFTEQGLAMLSGILKSDKAVNVNISIMRAFVVLRQFALTNDTLALKLKEIETKYDKQFKDIYEAINFLLNKEKQQITQKERTKIGNKK